MTEPRKAQASGCDARTDPLIAETGVDYISSSRITMAAPPLDLGLDVEIRS